MKAADLEDLRAAIPACMATDAAGFERRLEGLEQALARGRDPRDAGAALRAEVEASVARADARRARAPESIAYPEALPVSRRRDEIAAAIKAHPVVVLCGETGSGKTTQLPKMCLELGLGARGVIGHTQPRRIAARSVASRIASELGADAKGLVGWKVRFADHTGPDCRIKLMTDGILLAEIQQDPELRQYDTLIIDEAHERSLNIDFLLGYLKRLYPRRPDLKTIITSATIDPRRFAEHFEGAPVIEVSGRTFPVELRYRPPADDRTQAESIVAAIDELTARPAGAPGDTLVFLAGEREIRETAEALRKHHPPDTEILPLYSRLSASDQDRVFRATGRSRIVLATNVAETSLTVPGIRYVVDPGYARISRYSYRSKIQRLQIEAISQASANQRKGRCGREREGICIRLYDEEDAEARPRFTDPEIQRTNLASVILRMEMLNLGRPEDFPFVDPPDPRYIRDGYRLLAELGAVDAAGIVTDTGREMGRFPLDPRLARVLVAARDGGCVAEALVITSFLSVQDPRERPVDKRGAADEQHARFADPRSDFTGVLKLWRAYLEVRRHQSVSRQRRWCRDGFLSFPRMREWHDLHQQLLAQIKDAGWRLNTGEAAYAVLHKVLLTGFLGHIGERTDERGYVGARGLRFRIFPGSPLAARPPRWVVAAALVETSRVYARMAAAVEPAWIEHAAAHLVRREYGEPHWQEKRGFVAGYERVSLYGRVLVPRRRVDYGRVDPEVAHRVFLEEALVPGTLRTRGEFLAHNLELVDEVAALEARLRRRDLVADPGQLADFYATRVPKRICGTRAFERWRTRAERRDPRLLFMDRQDVLTTADEPDIEAYPDTLSVDGHDWPLSYVFDPASDADGITVTLPRALLPEVSPRVTDWLVPGLREEKVIELMRRLPKAMRRNLVPLPDTARAVMAGLRPGRETLPAGLSRMLRRERGLEVAPSAWDVEGLPDYLRMRLVVIDESDQPLAAGRDLAALKKRYGAGDRPLARPPRHEQAAAPWQGTDLKEWSFGAWPEAIESSGAGCPTLYPGIRDRESGVDLEVYASREAAERASRAGIRRLLMLATGEQVKYLRKTMGRDAAFVLAARDLAPDADLANRVISLAYDRVFLETHALPRDRTAFEDRLAAGRGALVGCAQDLASRIAEVAERRRELRLRLAERVGGEEGRRAAADMQDQLSALFPPAFPLGIPAEWLAEYPRYLKAMDLRLKRLAGGKSEAREREALNERWARVRGQLDRDWPSAESRDRFEQVRWLTEEFRVSLFAQGLGTRVKVSAVRLDRAWEALEAAVRAVG